MPIFLGTNICLFKYQNFGTHDIFYFCIVSSVKLAKYTNYVTKLTSNFTYYSNKYILHLHLMRAPLKYTLHFETYSSTKYNILTMPNHSFLHFLANIAKIWQSLTICQIAK